jgi:L-ornithine Nalpha-acyltransferase
LSGAPSVLGRFGPFEVRLAATRREIRKAQRLRFEVFYEEGQAIPHQGAALTRRDICPFDRFCDHLLVIDKEQLNRLGRKKPKVVGVYRLLRGDVAASHQGFYSETEFDIAPLLARHPGKRFLELGRSCVHAEYRSKRVIVRPLTGRGVDMAILDGKVIDARKGAAALPPLLKAYLRAGAKFGDGAVIDPQFRTTDVFTMMPLADLEERYMSYYGGPMELPDSYVA